jgi:hypothetical protein
MRNLFLCPNGRSWHTPAVDGREMLRLARAAALVFCDREIGGIVERQVWAASIPRSARSSTATSHCGEFEFLTRLGHSDPVINVYFAPNKRCTNP